MRQPFKETKALFLLITIISGIVILYPNLNFQFYLAPGDHGRDLYSYKKTFEGALPFRDYSSWHGPLMPYYYSLFYRLSGVSIQSTLYGYNLLALLIGIFIYLICATLLTPGISFLGAVWYWAFRYNEFFYTFNHIGAVFFMVVTIYCLLQFLRQPRPGCIYGASAGIIGALLVRPNIGLACLAAFYVSLLIIQIVKQKWDLPAFFRQCTPFLAGISLASIVIYGLLLRQAHPFALSNELAYWKAVHIENIFQNLIELKTTLMMIFNTSWLGRGFGLFLLLVTASSFFYMTKPATDSNEKKDLVLAMSSLLIFIVFALMEYLLGTRWFRWVWVLVPSIVLMFFLIGIGLKPLRLSIRRIIYLFLSLLAAYAVSGNHLSIQAGKVPANRLRIGKNDVYLAPFQQDNITIFTQVTGFLSKNPAPGEKIVAIAYEPLYYFLSGHDSAIRDLKFFSNPDNLRLLEENKVNYILISNRTIHNEEYPDQIFGQTFGVELARYLENNFEVAATFGPWGRPADWISNHAVKIYKRVTPKSVNTN